MNRATTGSGASTATHNVIVLLIIITNIIIIVKAIFIIMNIISCLSESELESASESLSSHDPRCQLCVTLSPPLVIVTNGVADIDVEFALRCVCLLTSSRHHFWRRTRLICK